MEEAVPIDNQLYDRLGQTWWDETAFLNVLRSGLNPARFGYMRRVLEDTLGVDPAGRRTLDIGCGGGLLAEEFARLGCRVTGIDPSEASLVTAGAHAEQSGLDIDYHHGFGEDLPFEDASFDTVYCCDVLEHVRDLPRVIAETARVLRPGGIYLYDTINRTLRSRLIAIKLWQEWPSTAFMEPDLHDWNMFIKPRELQALMLGNALAPGPIQGIAPALNPVSLIRVLRQRARGEMDFAEFGRRIRLSESRDRSVLYAGYAVRAA
jgi:2-polyprenyl-6-hydroxyphenyl methylase/3-demethylubiquinone-9 3-methyltransferase